MYEAPLLSNATSAREERRESPVTLLIESVSKIRDVARYSVIRGDDTRTRANWGRRSEAQGGGVGGEFNEDAITRSAKSANLDGLVFLTLMDAVPHIRANQPAGLRRLSWKRRIYSGNVLICRRLGSHLSSRRNARDWIARTLFTARRPPIKISR